MNHIAHSNYEEPTAIAVIGLAGRFPGAATIAEFWQNLRDGTESIVTFSDEELLHAGVPPSFLENKDYVKRGAPLDGMDLFDADFFGLTPREAELTDPQHRVFLELAWEALENSGYASAVFPGAIGLYAGTSVNNYFFERILPNQDIAHLASSLQLKIGNEKDFLCSRVAHQLNLHGPAVTVQTACSTSLVAVHLACQSILSGECDIALAGGVSIGMFRKQGYLYVDGGIDSRDGHCRAFDEGSSGTVSGDGAGIVVLKSLARAQSDGDTIHAVILGSAVNNDGADKVGFTAPSVNGQASVIAEALAVSGVEADSISYIEAHGTGTILGDPIEIKGLQQAFSLSTKRTQFCAIGSLKTNVGHLDAAAGVAGLIKTVLSLKNREIPASIHFTRANPHIDFETSPFYINSSLSSWSRGNVPRRAGVSAFGIGGTNAHVVLEEAPISEPSAPAKNSQLIVLSAKTQTALMRSAENLREALIAHPENNLADVAYTSQIGRCHFSFRHMLVCDNVKEAIEKLVAPALESNTNLVNGGQRRNLVFMFPGQGSQYLNMALRLYQSAPTFTAEIDRCADLLEPLLDINLREFLCSKEALTDEVGQTINRTDIAQAALFTIEYALARQLGDWGIHPSAMVGHSIGEYVAGCLAGVFSLDDALYLVAQRGRLMASLPGGSMIAAYASEAELAQLLDAEQWIASINAPATCAVSGTDESISRLKARLSDHQISYQTLRTSHGFHSGLMEPILDAFLECFTKIKLYAPKIPYMSNVSGTWITTEQATDPAYWAAHLRHPVRFRDCLLNLTCDGATTLLEVGPGKTLTSLAQQTISVDRSSVSVPTLPNANSSNDAWRTLMEGIGNLWLNGFSPDWQKFYEGTRRRRIPLPTYPFKKSRHMIEPRQLSNSARRSTASDYIKKISTSDWLYTSTWKRITNESSGAYRSPSARCLHLIFLNNSDLSKQFLISIKKDSEEIMVVQKGDRFHFDPVHFCTIDPSNTSHYTNMLAAVRDMQDFDTIRISHLWASSALANSTTDEQNDGLFSLLFIMQAFRELRLDLPCEINIVTTGVHSVLGNEDLFPGRGTALGPCLVLPLEFKNLKCRNLDFSPATEFTAAIVEQLVSEINSDIEDPIVAFRGLHRWIRSFEATQMASSRPTVLSDGGHYLITGGLGGIGLTFAKYLTDRIRNPRITLTGRTSIPPRLEWRSYIIEHGADDLTSKKIQNILSIEESGARINYIPADISNEIDVIFLKDNACAEAGPVKGIFHAAGVSSTETSFIKKTHQSVNKMLAPKVSGTNLIDKIFDAKNLDFLLLCSSVSTIAPTIGQLEYTAANSFLDVFAHRMSTFEGANVKSINWSTWQDVGMALEDLSQLSEEDRLQKQIYLENCIASTEAPSIFDAILASSHCQIAVIPVDFEVMIRGTAALNEFSREIIPNLVSLSTPGKNRPALSTDYVPYAADFQEQIGRIWENLFGFSQIGINDDFFELGGHSLLATQVISKIRQVLKASVPLHFLFEYPTISLLSARIEESYPDEVTFYKKVSSTTVDKIKREIDDMAETEIIALLDKKRRA